MMTGTPWLGHLKATVALTALLGLVLAAVTGDVVRTMVLVVIFLPIGYAILAAGWWLENRRRDEGPSPDPDR